MKRKGNHSGRTKGNHNQSTSSQSSDLNIASSTPDNTPKANLTKIKSSVMKSMSTDKLVATRYTSAYQARLLLKPSATDITKSRIRIGLVEDKSQEQKPEEFQGCHDSRKALAQKRKQEKRKQEKKNKNKKITKNKGFVHVNKAVPVPSMFQEPDFEKQQRFVNEVEREHNQIEPDVKQHSCTVESVNNDYDPLPPIKKCKRSSREFNDSGSNHCNHSASLVMSPPISSTLSKRDAHQKNSDHLNSDLDTDCIQDGKSSADESGYKLDHDKLTCWTISDTVIVAMKTHCQLTIKGKALLRCIYGQVCLHGFLLSHSQRDSYYPLYSPTSHSHMIIDILPAPEPIVISAVTSQYVRETLMAQCPRISVIQLADILSATKSCAAVLLLHRLSCSSCEFLMSCGPYQMLFGGGGRSEAENNQDVVSLSSIDVELRLDECCVNSLRTSEGHDAAADAFIDALHHVGGLGGSRDSPAIATCGGKNVGKSTFCRYLINKALNSVKAVAYLECDIGQTEFTPPGCVSLHLINQPLFGPPFSHQRNAQSMCYVGALTPSDNPRHYIKCLQHVYNTYLNMSKPRPPLIVNTMGWNKGLGLSLLVDILRLTSPDIVIQISCDGGQNKNLPEMTCEFVQSPPSWVEQLSFIQAPRQSSTNVYQLLNIHSHVNSNTISQSKFMSVDHRNMSLLAYLSRSAIGEHTDINKSDVCSSVSDFLAATPYQISLSDVALHSYHESVPSSQILYAFNASIVALCCVENNLIIDSGLPGCPKFLKHSPVCDAIGFGLIRGIDMNKKLMYIVTPVEPHLLNTVNCLLLGTVQVPQPISISQISARDVPYIGRPKDVIGATSVKSRRRKLQQRRSPNMDRRHADRRKDHM